MVKVVDLRANDAVKFTGLNLHISQPSGGGNVGLSGREHVTFTENRRWIGKVGVLSHTNEAIAYMRVIGDKLRGRVNTLLIPVCNNLTVKPTIGVNEYYLELGFTQAEIDAGVSYYSDGTGFTDGTGFVLPAPGPEISTDIIPAGSTSIKMVSMVGVLLKAGEYFSVNGFLYRVESNDLGDIVFNPPLREKIDVGQQIELDSPYIIVRLADQNGWEPANTVENKMMRMNVSFVEAFDR